MCLMLYIGTTTDLPHQADADIRVEDVEKSRLAVRHWFSSPFVHFVGAHTGCSCGFPSVIADSPVEYFDGMFSRADDRAADVNSVRALIHILTQATSGGSAVELYPVADGEEALAPKGAIDLKIDSLKPEQFLFNERFIHVVRGSSRQR